MTMRILSPQGTYIHNKTISQFQTNYNWNTIHNDTMTATTISVSNNNYIDKDVKHIMNFTRICIYTLHVYINIYNICILICK